MTATPLYRMTDLPSVRGTYHAAQDLSTLTWFRVGGAADIVYRPADSDDLAHFLREKDKAIPVYVMGAGSNILARDGGFRGVIIRLGRGFSDIKCDVETLSVVAGAAVLDAALARAACAAGLGGLEFYSGIPGTIGGALAMNAGAFGNETAKILRGVDALTYKGERLYIDAADIKFGYRRNPVAEEMIFTKAYFSCFSDAPDAIQMRMDDIIHTREKSQPKRAHSGGSCFKNPYGANDRPKAWELLDAAQCRGLQKGDAQFSKQHCNFLINHGNARAYDLENLGEMARARVKAQSGIDLHWEIKRIGEYYDG